MKRLPPDKWNPDGRQIVLQKHFLAGRELSLDVIF